MLASCMDADWFSTWGTVFLAAWTIFALGCMAGTMEDSRTAACTHITTHTRHFVLAHVNPYTQIVHVVLIEYVYKVTLNSLAVNKTQCV